MTISRLQREITRLRAELAIARGEGNTHDEELPDYEVERCDFFPSTSIKKINEKHFRVKQAVEDYMADFSKTASLDFSDFRKIQCAYGIFKVT